MNESSVTQEAKVLPFQAAGPYRLMAFPEGMPSSMDANQVSIDLAAGMVAQLAGKDPFSLLSPAEKDEARAKAILAATMLHTDGLRLVAYAIMRATHPTLMDAAPVVRAAHVDTLMSALRGAALRCFGVSDPKNHRALCDLIEHDEDDRAKRIKGGGF